MELMFPGAVLLLPFELLNVLSISQAVAIHIVTWFFHEKCLCEITDVLKLVFSRSIMGRVGVRFVFDNQ